jgi:hypothetical protein
VAQEPLSVESPVTLYYRLQDDEPGTFVSYDEGAKTLWEVAPAPGGWAVKKYDLTTMRVSKTHGGFHPGAVMATLTVWGCPDSAAWTVQPGRRVDVDRESVVYVIGSSQSHLVKIGRTDDPSRRVADIQRMSPVPLSLLWATPGGADLEARLHRRFAAHRQHGEWFDFGDADPVATVRGEIHK